LTFPAYDLFMLGNTSITNLLYLHGFRSSPQSAKAQLMAQVVARDYPSVTWWCPQLPPSPKEAMAMVAEGMTAWPSESMAVVGSSLGGFYATWVAERAGCKAVLLNPAVDPARDLEKYIGDVTSWHDPGENFYFKPEYIAELRDLTCGPLTNAARYFAIICKGDEVLDWREMYGRYAKAKMLLIEGGDHAISDFGTYVPAVLDHLQLIT
jgi:predicted esterase YcpF (UPF0227 family)